MRRLPQHLAAVIPFTATVLTVQPARADNSDELIQDELRVAHAPDGTPQTVVISRVVNAAGDVIRTTTETINNPPFRAQQADFPCISEGNRPGFAAHDVKHLVHHTHNDHAEFNYFPYSADNVRISSVTFKPQKQWLICATGGADANNGSRTVMTGPGIAFRDGGTTFKLGQVWKEGKTPANYSLNLGFEVPTDAVTIKAGITQTPTASLRGSPRPPFKSDVDAFSRNGANGWWEDSCAPDCVGTGGSSNWHGSVVEGLWEFPQSRPVNEDHFALSGFFLHRCANPFGCR
ncbi:MAG TPA: hypothetical protein VG034_11755 [Acidimicrobiia bacterium]|nr:hypothetical protein [Acidimicrobiia bacterium]